jgi:hypothetical protein
VLIGVRLYLSFFQTEIQIILINVSTSKMIHCKIDDFYYAILSPYNIAIPFPQMRKNLKKLVNFFIQPRSQALFSTGAYRREPGTKFCFISTKSHRSAGETVPLNVLCIIWA